MSRSTFTLFIGVFSVALYLFMTIFVLLFVTVFDASLEEVEADEDISEETKSIATESSDSVYAGAFIMLADFVLMFIASLLMVYGVKKELHQYIAPWVILSAIGLVLELAVIFFDIVEVDSDISTFAYVLTAVICAGIWYPVFKYYQSLKNPRFVAVHESHCSPAGYAVPAQVCAVPADYSHANAKYVPAAAVAAPHPNHIVYPSMPTTYSV